MKGHFDERNDNKMRVQFNEKEKIQNKKLSILAKRFAIQPKRKYRINFTEINKVVKKTKMNEWNANNLNL